jgi:riboflavin biosynthesis pyrimidine reductase
VVPTTWRRLRQDGVFYIFCGERELDLGLALEILNRELGIERLLLEGGGGSNGAFLRAGLIDEISLAICPAVDGAKGAPSIFACRYRRSSKHSFSRTLLFTV